LIFATPKTSLFGRAAVHNNHEDLDSINDAMKIMLDQQEQFFISYNKQRDKKFKVTGTGGPKKAMQFLKDGIRARKKNKKK
jgi:inorganic pyrophosphatase